MTRNDQGLPPPIGIIVGYGALPAALRDAALSIVDDPDGLEAVSSSSRRAEGLNEKLDEASSRHQGNPLLLFADLFGSSCALGGVGFRNRHPGTAVLCGVNLPMLIRFLYYRRQLTYDELVRFLIDSGREGVREA